ncbi:hypothetical protein JOM56_002130 [Amanita muscaria]
MTGPAYGSQGGALMNRTVFWWTTTIQNMYISHTSKLQNSTAFHRPFNPVPTPEGRYQTVIPILHNDRFRPANVAADVASTQCNQVYSECIQQAQLGGQVFLVSNLQCHERKALKFTVPTRLALWNHQQRQHTRHAFPGHHPNVRHSSEPNKPAPASRAAHDRSETIWSTARALLPMTPDSQRFPQEWFNFILCEISNLLGRRARPEANIGGLFIINPKFWKALVNNYNVRKMRNREEMKNKHQITSLDLNCMMVVMRKFHRFISVPKLT